MEYSILDNDLYKFTMQNAVIALFPRAKARFEFINRGKTVFPEGFAKNLTNRIHKLSQISLSIDEKSFLEKVCYYLPPTYFDFLKGYKFNPDEVEIKQKGGDVSISVEGYWYRTILWEVPLMAMISELYFEMTKPETLSHEEIIGKTISKAKKFVQMGVLFADFGTRRRFSQSNHNLVVSTLKENAPKNLVGTSNVYFAKKYKLTPIGTHAHEWFMFHAAKYGFKMANKLAMENWVKIYRGDLGIALSDTFTTDVFFLSFDTKLAKLFDGVRQDSGDPVEFGYKTIEHYNSLKIDPTSKSIVFSDGLNPEKVEELNSVFKDKIRTSYGIGTNLTNDVGAKPLNIVIKLTQAQPEGRDWIPTVKLSDSPGKYTGDFETITVAKKTLEIE